MSKLLPTPVGAKAWGFGTCEGCGKEDQVVFVFHSGQWCLPCLHGEEFNEAFAAWQAKKEDAPP